LPLSQASVLTHATPQPPQLSGSADSSTQLWPHVVKGVVQLATHMPDWQKVVVPLHTIPHPPQLFGSVPVSLHVPLHDVVFAGHAHALAVHVCPVGQASPHMPQFWLSLVVSTHVVPHSVSPIAQTD
jgi:hypothetical protein